MGFNSGFKGLIPIHFPKNGLLNFKDLRDMSRTKDVLFAKECIRDLEPAKLPMHTVP